MYRSLHVQNYKTVRDAWCDSSHWDLKLQASTYDIRLEWFAWADHCWPTYTGWAQAYSRVGMSHIRTWIGDASWSPLVIVRTSVGAIGKRWGNFDTYQSPFFLHTSHHEAFLWTLWPIPCQMIYGEFHYHLSIHVLKGSVPFFFCTKPISVLMRRLMMRDSHISFSMRKEILETPRILDTGVSWSRH